MQCRWSPWSVVPGLVLGVRDYARKCGFQSLAGVKRRHRLGPGGGDRRAALGNEPVSALMPSLELGGIDRRCLALAQRLGLQTNTVPIAGLMEGYDQALTAPLGETPQG